MVQIEGEAKKINFKPSIQNIETKSIKNALHIITFVLVPKELQNINGFNKKKS